MLWRAGRLESSGSSSCSAHLGGLESPISQIDESLFPDSRRAGHLAVSACLLAMPLVSPLYRSWRRGSGIVLGNGSRT